MGGFIVFCVVSLCCGISVGAYLGTLTVRLQCGRVSRVRFFETARRRLILERAGAKLLGDAVALDTSFVKKFLDCEGDAQHFRT